jgi:hypothetical protein
MPELLANILAEHAYDPVSLVTPSCYTSRLGSC